MVFFYLANFTFHFIDRLGYIISTLQHRHDLFSNLLFCFLFAPFVRRMTFSYIEKALSVSLKISWFKKKRKTN